GDYRKLNSVTIPDRYTIPNIQDFFSSIRDAKLFSKIDLWKAYHQIPIAEEDIEKTAVITPFGLYEYLFMPFGLKNAAQTFQRYIDAIIRDLTFSCAYIDDILVVSNEDQEQHLRNIEILFKRLEENNLIIQLPKCEFLKRSIDFLGHTIDKDGIKPSASNQEAIIDFPVPKSKKQLQRFLGMFNFYRRFYVMIASDLKPLYDLTKSKVKFIWTETAEAAFNKIKQLWQRNYVNSPRSRRRISPINRRFELCNWCCTSTKYQWRTSTSSLFLQMP
ncbi:hypothetical protein SSS_09590, partial [Sarcoptes scabiei]